jgi:hypothetical protein
MSNVKCYTIPKKDYQRLFKYKVMQNVDIKVSAHDAGGSGMEIIYPNKGQMTINCWNVVNFDTWLLQKEMFWLDV